MGSGVSERRTSALAARMNGIKGGGGGGPFYGFIVRRCRWRRALRGRGRRNRHVTGGGAGCPLVAQDGDLNDVSRIPPGLSLIGEPGGAQPALP